MIVRIIRRVYRAFMDIAAVFALSLAPGVLWLYFIYRREKGGGLGYRFALRLFLAGMLLVLPAAAVEHPFRSWGAAQIALIAPFAEEAIKFTAVWWMAVRKGAFERPIDGMSHAATVALGFASAENIFYIISSYLAPQLALGIRDPLFGASMVWKLYLLRSLLTVPGHAVWSSMWGYALAMAAFTQRKRATVAKGFALSVALHALFNYFIITHPVGAVGMLVLVPAMWRMFYDRVDKAIRMGTHPREDWPNGPPGQSS